MQMHLDKMRRLVVALAVTCLAMSVTSAGQVPIQAMIDPMLAMESRANTRSISWMDFNKAPARPPPVQQERIQWRQPSPVSANSAPTANSNNNDNNNNNRRQQWSRAKWDEEFLPAQQHPAGSDRFRYQHEPLYRSDALNIRGSSGEQVEQAPARRANPVQLQPQPVIVVQSDELTEEYDSSELFDDEFDEDRSVAKSDVDESVLIDDDEADPMEDDPLVITARPRPTPVPKTDASSNEWPASQENQAVWQRYPQLLAQPTPPGKRVIVAEDHAPAAHPAKPSQNHRISYGLTAASHYARLQPSLKPKNGTGQRQRVVPRPYRKRPTSSTTTTARPHAELDGDLEIDHEPELDATKEIEPAVEDEMPEGDVDELPDLEFKSQEENVDSIPDDEESDEFQLPDTEQPEDEETLPPATTTTTTTTTSTTPSTTTTMTTTSPRPSPQTDSPKPAGGPVDIKELLRNAGPLSLSEILQQKGMSLAELLKGNGGTRIAPVIANSDAASPKSESTTTAAATTTSTTTAAATTARPDTLPPVKPISLKELLAAKNMSITDILKPNESAKAEKPAEIPSPTLKPGVKRPVPFSPGRAKGLAGLVAPTTAPPETSESERPKERPELASKPSETKPAIELKPLIFGGGGTVGEAGSTTTTQATKLVPVQTKRPYVPGTRVGEYGTHVGRSYEEDDDEEDSSPKSIFSGMVGGYGNQRPIAISRITPTPARKSRPVLNFNYNALSDEEEEEDAGEQTTVTPIMTHFNEDELKEDHPYFDLPLSVRSAIIASSAVAGFCLLVFMVILTVFMVKQKTRIRLRHPTALFGMSTTALTPSNGSESSGITTPVSQPTSKGGYAKLPQRSSSLWGTLRRSVRQINSVHYS